jgi:hypothetical protein
VAVHRDGRFAISRSISSRPTFACTNLSLYICLKHTYEVKSNKQQRREDQMSRNYSSTIVE